MLFGGYFEVLFIKIVFSGAVGGVMRPFHMANYLNEKYSELYKQVAMVMDAVGELRI